MKNIFSNRTAREILYEKKILNRTYRNQLEKNKELSQKYKGRCFIIGNGPSINEQDLSILKNEFVFTVNQIARHKDFSEIQSNVHFWADPVFFKLQNCVPENAELFDSMKNINTNSNRPLCFFPIEHRDFVENTGLNKELDIRFFCVSHSLKENYNRNIDFRRGLPAVNTVVQYAIQLAIYMGFSEIYLLGCDCTGIVNNVQMRYDNEMQIQYAYNITESEIKRMKERNDNVPMELELQSFYKLFRGYRILNQYCKMRNIRLVNATKGGVLDNLPRVEYNSLFDIGVNNEK